MATVADLQAEIEQVGREIQAAGAQIRGGTVTPTQEAELITKRDQLRNRLRQLNAELAVASSQSAATGEFEGQDTNTGLYRYKNPVTGNSFLSGTAPTAAQQAASGVKLDPPVTQPEPPATASQTVQDDASQGPNAPPAQQVTASGQTVTPPAVTTPTNADAPATAETGAGADSNIDPPVKTLEQTQATGPQPPEPPSSNPRTERISNQLTTTPGAGLNDENPPPTTNTRQTEVNTDQSTMMVKAQPNVLDKYSSYTYSASVYLCTQSQYKKMLAGVDKKIDGYQLLFQSGGAPASDGVIRPAQIQTQENPNDPSSANSSWSGYSTAGRNPFFDADFYIDNITVETVTTGKGSGAAHMNATLKFTVIEPMGITLLNRLYKAVQNFAPIEGTGKVNYTSAIYLMVIRFYGYDENGNIVMPIKGGLQTPGDTSDPKAVVEKFIPFQINRINWSVGSKLVSYEWDCTPVGQLLGAYSARGTIPYDVQLTDSTVGGLLKGPAKYSNAQATNANPGTSTANQSNAETARLNRQAGNTPAPPTAAGAPAPKKTVTQGLIGALNEYQADLVQRGIYTLPDEYEIEFLGNNDVPASAIENAKLQLPNQKVDKAKTAGGESSTTNPNNLRTEANPVNMASRSFSITAGQQVLQAIELAIRNSSYISNQSIVVVNPDGSQSPNSNAKNTPLQWFNISMSAEPTSTTLDPKRNDYAYKIKYTVTPFRPANVASKYFPASKFKGIHKSYPYWFTGKNTAVREYQETLNALYTLTVSGNAPNNSVATIQADRFTSSMQEIVKYNYSPASNASRSGADGKSLEANANAAEVLYSPGDLAAAKVKIIGDPAWIMQGSMFKPLTGKGFTQASQTGFEPDGTISFDSQDVLFEIVWQRPEDYDINTGIADPYKKTAANGQSRQPLQSRVYICTKVTSEFKNGAFDQTLDGSLYLFPKLDKSNTANPAAAVSSDATTDGSDNRFARQGNANSGRIPAGTSNAGAGRSSSQFAATDPRRSDVGDGGKAAILGAQKSLTSGAREFQTNGGGAAFGNPNLTRQGVNAQANTVLENAPQPAPATSGTGNDIEPVVGQTTVTAPPKLPAVGSGQSTLTPEQKREVTRRALEQTNRELAEEAEEFPPGGPPNQTVIPNNQKIVRQR